MCTSLFPIIWIKYYLNYFYFLNNLSYSCVDTCVSECFLIILVTTFKKKVYWAEKRFMRWVLRTNDDSCICIFIWYSHWQYNKNAIKYWLSQESTYHLECLFPKTCITSIWELSFVKTKTYAIFPNIFAKLNIFIIGGKYISIKSNTNLNICCNQAFLFYTII